MSLVNEITSKNRDLIPSVEVNHKTVLESHGYFFMWDKNFFKQYSSSDEQPKSRDYRFISLLAVNTEF